MSSKAKSKIREAREERGLTQVQLSADTGGVLKVADIGAAEHLGANR
jgi:DNA-binding XRE family transcriptional regulator